MAPIDPQGQAGKRLPGHLPVGLIAGVAACSLVALGALAALAARVVSFTQRREGLLGGMRPATSAFLSRLNDPPRPPRAPHGPPCFRPARLRPAPQSARADPAASRPDGPATEPGTGRPAG